MCEDNWVVRRAINKRPKLASATKTKKNLLQVEGRRQLGKSKQQQNREHKKVLKVHLAKNIHVGHNKSGWCA
jgi:hypothetical protein